MRRFLIVIQLDPMSDLNRIAQDAPQIIRMIDGFSKDAPLLAFRSNDGNLSGFLIEMNKPAGMLQSEFEKCSATRNGDSVLILEIGDEIGGTSGMSRAWSWLQHHKLQ